MRKMHKILQEYANPMSMTKEFEILRELGVDEFELLYLMEKQKARKKWED